MWRLFHWLFGWHYVLYRWGNYGERAETCRIHYSGDGRPYICPWEDCIFLDEPGIRERCVPLSWNPDDTEVRA